MKHQPSPENWPRKLTESLKEKSKKNPTSIKNPHFKNPIYHSETLLPADVPIIALFDLDGTLVDSLDFTFRAFNFGIKSQGLTEKSPEEIMRYFGPWERSIFSAIVGEEKADAACTAYENFVLENISEISLFPEIEEVFAFLDSNNITTGIVTGRSAKTTEMILNHHHRNSARWVKQVHPVVCNDHVLRPKPAPDGIQLAIEFLENEFSFQNSQLKRQVFYFGDSWVDVEAAKAAGAKAVSCLWDSRTKRNHLEEKKPDFLLNHPKEIISVLNDYLKI